MSPSSARARGSLRKRQTQTTVPRATNKLTMGNRPASKIWPVTSQPNT